MSWWDDVKFVVTDAVNPAAAAVQAAAPPAGQATDAVLGQEGFAGPAAPAANAVNAVNSGSGSAGTISMSREEMEDTLRRAQNLLTDIRDAMGPADRLTRMRPPAEDDASKVATNSANNAGTYYVGHLRRQEAYLRTVIDKMQKALGITAQADQDNADAAKRAGEGSLG